MGLLVDGIWRDEQPGERTPDGHFVRPATRFRNWVTPDGSAGPTGEAGFPAARDRYHLYVALPCPWAHRTVIMRVLKGLEDVVSKVPLRLGRERKGAVHLRQRRPKELSLE